MQSITLVTWLVTSVTWFLYNLLYLAAALCYTITFLFIFALLLQICYVTYLSSFYKKSDVMKYSGWDNCYSFYLGCRICFSILASNDNGQ